MVNHKKVLVHIKLG